MLPAIGSATHRNGRDVSGSSGTVTSVEPGEFHSGRNPGGRALSSSRHSTTASSVSVRTAFSMAVASSGRHAGIGRSRCGGGTSPTAATSPAHSAPPFPPSVAGLGCPARRASSSPCDRSENAHRHQRAGAHVCAAHRRRTRFDSGRLPSRASSAGPRADGAGRPPPPAAANRRRPRVGLSAHA